MSEQYYPTFQQNSAPPPVYAPPSRLSVWRIAAAVFVGNFLCLLIGLVLYLCLAVGVAVLSGATNR